MILLKSFLLNKDRIMTNTIFDIKVLDDEDDNLGLSLVVKKEKGNYTELYTIFSQKCEWRFVKRGKVLISTFGYYWDDMETDEQIELARIKNKQLSIIDIKPKPNNDYSIILTDDTTIEFICTGNVSDGTSVITMKCEDDTVISSIPQISKILNR